MDNTISLGYPMRQTLSEWWSLHIASEVSLMDEQLSPKRKLTVYSLLLHTIVLLIFAAIVFFIGLSQGGSPFSGVNFMPIAYFGSMSVLAIWLSSRHYLKKVQKRNLLIWAALHIFGSLYMFFNMLWLSSLHPLLPPTHFIVFLIPLIAYNIPPVLITISARREQT